MDHYFKELNGPGEDYKDLVMVDKSVCMCGGKSLLFISMCRNIGIPARKVNGFFLRNGWVNLRDEVMHDDWLDLHVWAEFYDKGYWHPVDINIAQQTHKDYFGSFPEKLFNRKDERLVISTGSYFKVEGKEFDYLQTAYTGKNNVKESLIV